MIIQKFDEKILQTLLSKQCILSFVSAPGAQGPSGLIFAIFDDGFLYYLNQNEKDFNNDFLIEIKSYVPEMALPINCSYKKDKAEIVLVLLGQGNCCSMVESTNNKYSKFCETSQTIHAYKIFKEFLLAEYKLDINELYSISLKDNG